MIEEEAGGADVLTATALGMSAAEFDAWLLELSLASADNNFEGWLECAGVDLDDFLDGLTR